MREIKFRGFIKQDGQLKKGWIYGTPIFHFEYKNGVLIHERGERKMYDIFSESLGQYTGLKDKNGKEIYEGDVLKPIDGVMKHSRVVEFVDGSFCYELKEQRREGGFIAIGKQRGALFEIIGNIYENSNLLK